MKRLALSAMLLMLLTCFADRASAQTTRPISYMMIPVIGDIGSEVTPGHLDSLLHYARDHHITYAILLFDTKGGAVDQANQIKARLGLSSEPLTVALVKNASGEAEGIAKACNLSFFHADSQQAKSDPSSKYPRTISDVRDALGFKEWTEVAAPQMVRIVVPPSDPVVVQREQAAAKAIADKNRANADEITATADRNKANPRLRLACRWLHEGGDKHTLSYKLWNPEEYEVWVKEVSLDNRTWYSVEEGCPAAGTMEFTIKAKQEPVVTYLKTSKHGIFKFPNLQPW